MEHNTLYSEKFLKLIRVISCVSIIIYLVLNILKIRALIKNTFEIDALFFYMTIAIDFLVCIICIVLVFLPTKIKLISLIAFMYSGLILVFDIENPMGVFMFFLGIASLVARGFYSKRAKLKILLAFIFFFGLLLSELRFGFALFFKYLIEKIGYSVVTFVILFFLWSYLKNIYDSKSSDKILNLYEYKGLKKRDAKWLCLVQKNEKYDNIARECGMSSGFVKNRLKIVYSILEVGDRTGFLNRFGDFDIVYIEPPRKTEIYKIKATLNITNKDES